MTVLENKYIMYNKLFTYRNNRFEPPFPRDKEPFLLRLLTFIMQNRSNEHSKDWCRELKSALTVIRNEAKFGFLYPIDIGHQGYRAFKKVFDEIAVNRQSDKGTSTLYSPN